MWILILYLLLSSSYYSLNSFARVTCWRVHQLGELIWNLAMLSVLDSSKLKI